jgi:flavin-dependent dehydrogenase
MVEVLVAGAGPAGAVTALCLARAGVRVLLVDRSRFPRDKLCGDTLNPGAMAVLRTLGLAGPVESAGVPLEGMTVTGPHGVCVEATYAAGQRGYAMSRRELDIRLVEAAAAAGAQVELGVRVCAPLVEEDAAVPRVRGVELAARGRRVRLPATVTVAADGRRSTLAFALGLARHPARPRRWAVGAYIEGMAGMQPRGEMHIRPGHYLGLSPLPGGVTNACLVTADRARLADASGALDEVLRRDPQLRDRATAVRRISPVTTLGPLAMEVAGTGLPGLVLAGDAAGFVDPMTGDGLRLAVHGAWLAAGAVLAELETPGVEAWRRLAAARRQAFARKLRVNRLLREMVARPTAVRVGAIGARFAPCVLRRVVRFAGDEAFARRWSTS